MDFVTMQKFKLNITDQSRFRLTIAVIVVSVIALLGITARAISEFQLRRHTNLAAVTQVATIKALPAPAVEEIILPGNVQAWHEATIYARTNGYVKDWKTDIGAHVKAGDLLAVIETPELDAQLRQAEADLKTAEANNHLAQTTAVRWRVLLKTESVSKQEADEKNADALAKAAIVKAAIANRDHLNLDSAVEPHPTV
jgi:multidrug efflux pump subunit AcrA (membrane-fusion protein)